MNKWEEDTLRLKAISDNSIKCRCGHSIFTSDKEIICRCGALNIDGNRVPSETPINIHNAPKGTFAGGEPDRGSDTESYREQDGRYPSQTFCDSNTAEVLDKQGYVSKILHKCNYEKEDYDIYFYKSKVSKSERNAGCDDIQESSITEKKGNGLGRVCSICGTKQLTPCDCTNNEWVLPSNMKNNHPTLKPIALNEKILKLFKTPNDDKIVYPFAGSGSEIIGGIKAGFNNWVGCEINPDYVEIAKARIDYWTTQDNQLTIFDIERECI